MNINLLLLSILLLPSLAFASGSASSSNSGGFFPSSSSVDQAYEYGKALYTGRSSEVERFKYCIVSEEEPIEVKRSSLRQFKGTSLNELAASLIDCDNPEKSMFDYVDSTQASYVLYYLNKRYKLGLDIIDS